MHNYQEQARTTDLTPFNILCHVLGLLGECGEVINLITPKDKALFDLMVATQANLATLQTYKRYMRDDGVHYSFAVSDPDKLRKELQDVLWHIAALYTDLGVDMNAEMQENIKRLADRQKRNVIKGSGDNR